MVHVSLCQMAGRALNSSKDYHDLASYSQIIKESLETGEIPEDIAPKALSILERVLRFVVLGDRSWAIGNAVNIVMTAKWQEYQLSNKEKITQMKSDSNNWHSGRDLNRNVAPPCPRRDRLCPLHIVKRC